MIAKPKDKDCQLNVAPFYQCCCNCSYHKPVHYNCVTRPKPKKLLRDGKCVCGVFKSWACCVPEDDRIYDNWGLHSCGCELYNPIVKYDRPKAHEPQ